MPSDARAATVKYLETRLVSTSWAHQIVWVGMGKFLTEGSSVPHGLGRCAGYMQIMRTSISTHYNREMDEEDEELSRIVHVRSLSGSPPWTSLYLKIKIIIYFI